MGQQVGKTDRCIQKLLGDLGYANNQLKENETIKKMKKLRKKNCISKL